MSSINLYDEDTEKIRKVGIVLQKKWNFIAQRLDPWPYTEKNRKMIDLWHDEVVKHYEEIGFVAEVDVTPAYAKLSPPVISIVKRIRHHEFDFDKKIWEVKKSKEQGSR